MYHWGAAWLRLPNEIASPLPGNFDSLLTTHYSLLTTYYLLWLCLPLGNFDCPRPQRVAELNDVAQIACTPPGYYHARAGGQGYACAAVTRLTLTLTPTLALHPSPSPSPSVNLSPTLIPTLTR